MRLNGSEIREPLNIGSRERVTINQLIDAVEEIAGIEVERRYDRGVPQGVVAETATIR